MVHNSFPDMFVVTCLVSDFDIRSQMFYLFAVDFATTVRCHGATSSGLSFIIVLEVQTRRFRVSCATQNGWLSQVRHCIRWGAEQIRQGCQARSLRHLASSGLSDPTEIPPYRETGVVIPLSHCVSCGIADYRCYTPTTFCTKGRSQSERGLGRGVSQKSSHLKPIALQGASHEIVSPIAL